MQSTYISPGVGWKKGMSGFISDESMCYSNVALQQLPVSDIFMFFSTFQNAGSSREHEAQVENTWIVQPGLDTITAARRRRAFNQRKDCRQHIDYYDYSVLRSDSLFQTECTVNKWKSASIEKQEIRFESKEKGTICPGYISLCLWCSLI